MIRENIQRGKKRVDYLPAFKREIGEAVREKTWMRVS